MDQKDTIQQTQAKIWKTLDRISAMDEKTRQDHEKARQDHEKARQDHAKARQEMAEIRARQDARDKKAKQEMAVLRAERQADHAKARREMAEIRASQKELSASRAARDKRIDREFRQAKELFTGKWGMLVESLIEGNLVKQLNKRNIQVHDTDQRVHGCILITDSQGRKQQKKCEIDIIAQNGKEVVAVEVKTSLNKKDVDKFLETLKLFTQYWPGYKDNTVYGAVAYLRVQSGAEVYAEKNGLFVIRATGDSSSIVNRPNFKPKSFS